MSRQETTVGHISTLHFHDFVKCVSCSCDLHNVELCDILLCWLSRIGNFEIEAMITEFKRINDDVTQNFEKFQVQSNPRKKGNITIRVPSHSLVKAIAAQAKVTQERVIISLLASIYINEGHENYTDTVEFIKSQILYNWAIKKHKYNDFLKTLPNYRITRRRKR